MLFINDALLFIESIFRNFKSRLSKNEWNKQINEINKNENKLQIKNTLFNAYLNFFILKLFE